MRAKTVNDVPESQVQQALSQAGTTPEEAEAIFRLTSLPTYDERFVVPPMAREMAIEEQLPPPGPSAHKSAAGFGFRKAPQRRW